MEQASESTDAEVLLELDEETEQELIDKGTGGSVEESTEVVLVHESESARVSESAADVSHEAQESPFSLFEARDEEAARVRAEQSGKEVAGEGASEEDEGKPPPTNPSRPSPGGARRGRARMETDHTRSFAFRAMMRKNATLMLRRWRLVLFQMCFPIVLVVFVGGMQHVVDDVLPTVDGNPFRGGAEYDLNAVNAFVSPYLDQYEKYWVIDSTRGSAKSEHSAGGGDSDSAGGGHSDSAWDETGREAWRAEDLGQASTQMNATNEGGSELGELTKGGGRRGLLGNVTQINVLLANQTFIRVPFFEPREDLTGAQQEIQDGLTELNFHTPREIAKGELLYSLPDAVFEVTAFEVNSTGTNSTCNLEYTMMYNDDPVYMRVQKLPAQDKRKLSKLQPMANMHAALLYQATGEVVSIRAEPMPYNATAPVVILSDIVGVALVPFSVFFMIPMFMHTVVMEKENRLREFMKMMRVSTLVYWVYNYIFNVAMYSLVVVVLVGVELWYEVRLFTQTHWAIIVLLFVLWSLVEIPFAFALSIAFQRSSTSSLVGYLLIVVGVIVAEMMNQFIFPSPAGMPWLWYLWPPFLFQRCIYQLITSCAELRCVDWDAFTAMWNRVGHADGEVATLFAAMLCYALVLPPLVYVLDLIFPGEYGVPIRPFKALLLFIRKRYLSIGRHSHDVSVEMDTVESLLRQRPTDVSEDVFAEQERVRSDAVLSTCPIVVRGLTKQFHGGALFGQTLTAVDNLSLGIADNEVFGLLGPNGAGKTTLIGMLTGLFPPTSGSAFVAGYNIANDMREIHRHIGVCPQFDVQWDMLTAREHLLFYTRLRGVPKELEAAHVNMLLEQVRLSDHADRKVASELSGGMRRRLSVAMALAGGTRIVFLDEPTSGLDPISRRELWDIVDDCKIGRCMILTTHSMEEADVLCNRVGILHHGRFQCVGTPAELKDRYGGGYRIEAVFPAQVSDRFEFVLHPDSLPPTPRRRDSAEDLPPVLDLAAAGSRSPNATDTLALLSILDDDRDLSVQAPESIERRRPMRGCGISGVGNSSDEEGEDGGVAGELEGHSALFTLDVFERMIGAVVPVHGSSSSGDVAIVRVSKDDVCSERLLQLLEELKAKGRIIEWGITRTSLEDVFMKVVAASDDGDVDVE